jgi:hypothetical protein
MLLSLNVYQLYCFSYPETIVCWVLPFGVVLGEIYPYMASPSKSSSAYTFLAETNILTYYALQSIDER